MISFRSYVRVLYVIVKISIVFVKYLVRDHQDLFLPRCGLAFVYDVEAKPIDIL